VAQPQLGRDRRVGPAQGDQNQHLPDVLPARRMPESGRPDLRSAPSQQPSISVRVRAEIAVRHRRVFGIGGRRQLRPTVEIVGRSFPTGAPVTGRRLRRGRRRCKWRAGPAAAPSAARNTGAPVRSPMTRLIARAVRGASAMVMTLPPLRVIARVRRVTGAGRPLLPVPWRSFRCNVEIGQYLGSVALMHDRDRTNHVQTFCLRY
jgi:hypothetical protein